MKRILSLTLAAILAASASVSCASHSSLLTPNSSLRSSSGSPSVTALYTRLVGEAPDGVTLASGEDAEKYADLSSLRDEGYVIRRSGDDTFILGKTDDGLDRAVRYYANHAPKTGDYSYTYGEGYKVKRITVAGNDISDYSVMLDPDADWLHTYAAEELSNHIGRACGYYPPVVAGTDRHYFAFDRVTTDDPRYAEYGDEGYSFEVRDGNVIIVCGELRGAIYGVYAFLEDYIGWRFVCDWENFCQNPAAYDDDFTDFLYDSDGIDIPEGIKTAVIEPAFTLRSLFRTGDKTYAMKKTDTHQIKGNRQYNGERVNAAANHGLMKFLDVHSEYQPIYYDQPCFTDELMIEDAETFYIDMVETKLASGMKVGYDLVDIDVAQPDCWTFCTCKNCAKVVKEEGSDTGPVLRFTNHMADVLGELYPGLYVDMLSYQGTTHPTKTPPRDNVSISYCFFFDHNKECCYSHPLDGSQCESGKISNLIYAEELEKWCEVCSRVIVWYYPGVWNNAAITSSSLKNVIPEMRWFLSLDLYGLYCCPSGCTWSGGGYNHTEEMILPYLMLEMIRHPDMTDEEIDAFILDYLTVMCGEGAPEMLQYYKKLESWDAGGCWSSMYTTSPNDRTNFGTVERTIDSMLALFDEARQLATTKAQEEFVDRMSRTVYFTGLTATHTDWYLNGTAEQKAHYTELYEKFLDINDRLPMRFGGGFMEPSARNYTRDKFDITVNPGTMVPYFGNPAENWWDIK